MLLGFSCDTRKFYNGDTLSPYGNNKMYVLINRLELGMAWSLGKTVIFAHLTLANLKSFLSSVQVFTFGSDMVPFVQDESIFITVFFFFLRCFRGWHSIFCLSGQGDNSNALSFIFIHSFILYILPWDT